jgi:hypothetical protein
MPTTSIGGTAGSVLGAVGETDGLGWTGAGEADEAGENEGAEEAIGADEEAIAADEADEAGGTGTAPDRS